MGLPEKTLFISLMSFILQFKSGNSQCFNAEEMTVSQLGLSESQIWNAKAQDLEQCAKLCVRRKPCLSITYDTQSGMCELNAGTRNDTRIKTGATLLYSEFQWWPSSLDKNCYSRPCQDSEACIPGGLADGSPDCSYSCMTVVRDVCPLPSWGVSNGRTVGSVNVYLCGKGTVGGGNATCLPTKQWDKDIVPNCTPILDHPCSDDNLCSLINGSCSANGRCECGLYKTYDETEKECVLDCGAPPDVANAVVSGNTTIQTYQCEPGYSPAAGSEASITCTENGWEPANSFACYTCGAPPVVAGATLSGDGLVRHYTCDNNMYLLPGVGNGTITCDVDTSTWIPVHDFLCGGLRLTQGPLPEMNITQHSGYLEMFAEGEWRALTEEDWTWQATKVACRKLFGSNFGGTFHKNWFDTANPSRLSKVSKMDNIVCTGEEEALEQCEYDLKNGNGDKEIALTCFEYDFAAPENVMLYESDGETVLTKFAGSYGGVCGSGWNDQATTVACRTLNPSWTRNKECKDNCGSPYAGSIHTNHIHCDGDEPHLFYCENRGWGYHADCDLNKLVTMQCNTGGGDS